MAKPTNCTQAITLLICTRKFEFPISAERPPTLRDCGVVSGMLFGVAGITEIAHSITVPLNVLKVNWVRLQDLQNVM
jgi:hypothetical protein